MLVGIGEATGYKNDKLMIVIKECTDQSCVGKFWFSDRIIHDNFVVVKFDPEDQFCHPMTVDQLQEVLNA
jgi:hypothetical protein